MPGRRAGSPVLPLLPGCRTPALCTGGKPCQVPPGLQCARSLTLTGAAAACGCQVHRARVFLGGGAQEGVGQPTCSAAALLRLGPGHRHDLQRV
jgi:hypothetical protein